ncbi:MAG: PEP-CTERM sorting domain-containing protein [Desulfuromonadales bacterium]|nr:PEP-CTERM sorting domain-containing protein [Desulfuromonadales bacterium]
MFGASTSTVEQNYTLFNDSPTGDRHWVEWQTASVITLRSFNLVAAHDNSNSTPPRNITWRGFTDFYLYTGDGSSWTEIYHYVTDQDGNGLYDGENNETYKDPDYLELAVDLTPVLSQNFRAEFVYGPSYNLKGSRIFELDGYDTFLDGTTGENPGPGPDPVPEPSTFLLLGSGLAGLAVYGRKRKKA